MEKKEKILKMIYSAVDEANDQSSEHEKLEKLLETILFKKEDKMDAPGLDSLGFVIFFTALEKKIEEEFNVEVTLEYERVVADREGIFDTIAKLVDYIDGLLEQKSDDAATDGEDNK